MAEDREARVRRALEAEGSGLRRREDGFYHVTEDGQDTAPNGWRVRTWQLNDRGGEVGSPYPLTLDEVQYSLGWGTGRPPAPGGRRSRTSAPR